MYKEEELTKQIIGIAMAVHRELGPGFKEEVYHMAMIVALEEVRLKFESEKEYDVFFRKRLIATFRIDLLVEDKIVVELKAVAGEMQKLFQTQTISYLKASNLEVALLINFANRSLEVKRLGRYHDYVYDQK